MLIYDIRELKEWDANLDRHFKAFDKATSGKPAKRNRKAIVRVGSGTMVGPRAASAKVFDTEKPIPARDLADMREAGILAASKPRRQKARAKSRQPRPNT